MPFTVFPKPSNLHVSFNIRRDVRYLTLTWAAPPARIKAKRKVKSL